MTFAPGTLRWPRRILRWSLIALLGTWAVYLVAMNVFIRTHLFRNLISEDPDAILVGYTTAYSIVPGHIHVEGLHIRGKDSNVEWILILDRCDFRVSFADLANHRFHASHVRGDGLSLRVRLRKPAFTPEEIAAIPPVPGFSDPPFAGPPPPVLTDETYNLWSIWLEDVVAEHVRELWIDTIRYAGDMQIDGRWYFRPIRWLDVGPASIDVRMLDVSYGPDEVWVSGAVGHLVVAIHPYDVRAVAGTNIVDQVSVSGDLRGALHGVPVANRLLRGTAATVERADTQFDAILAIDHGVLRPGASVQLARFPVVARAAGFVVDGTLEAKVGVDPGSVGHAAIDARALRIELAGTPRGLAARVAGTFDSRELDLSKPFADTSYELDLEDLRTESLSFWQRRFGLAPSVAVESGLATARGHLSGVIARRSAKGNAHFDVQSLSVESAGKRVRADAAGDLVGSASLKDKHAELTGSAITLRAVRADAKGATILASRITVEAHRLVATPAGVLGDVAVDAPDIQVPAMANLTALLPLPGGISIEAGAARGSAALDVDLGEGAVEGAVKLAGRGVRAQVGSHAMVGELDVALQARRDGAVTDVSGSTVQFREYAQEGWWIRAALQRAQLFSQGGIRFRAHVVADAKDASPVATMIESGAGEPAKLAIGAIPMTGLRLNGDVVIGPAALEARGLHASTDGFSLDLELAKLGPSQTVAVYLVVGLVHAGVDLTDGKTSFLLFGAEPWFVAKTAELRARERAFD